ncbi:MAG: NYN domain-containing protein, partial [Candidatus Marinimicrobia bacterium]|nr:NYN domain-containing protein [Candidatus Neomarinimicrobiota bacterium]
NLAPVAGRRVGGEGHERGRRVVIRGEERGAHALGAWLTVVFDGRGEQPSVESLPPGVEVVFTPGRQTADSYIERLVCAAARPERIWVVCSDRAELDTVTAAGAQGMSCRQFIETVVSTAATLAGVRRMTRRPGARLGDFFPG